MQQMRKSALFQIAGKLQYTPTDNGFKQVQNAYLAVISNLDKLVQYCYMLPMQIRQGLWLAKQYTSLFISAEIKIYLSEIKVTSVAYVYNFRVQSVKACQQKYVQYILTTQFP